MYGLYCVHHSRGPSRCEAQGLRRDLLPHSTLERCRRWERQRVHRVLHRPFFRKLHAALHTQLCLLQVDAAEHFPCRRMDAGLPLAGFAAVLHKAVPVSRAHGLPFAVQRCLADLQPRMPRLQPLDEIPVRLLSLAGAAAELPPLRHGIHPERDLAALFHRVCVQFLAARPGACPPLMRRTPSPSAAVASAFSPCCMYQRCWASRGREDIAIWYCGRPFLFMICVASSLPSRFSLNGCDSAFH